MERPVVGPRYGYPRIARRSRFLAVAAEYARPFTVFAAFMVGLFLGLILDAGLMVSVILGLFFGAGQALGQTVNQIADVDIDRINKPYRPLPSGRSTIEEAWLIAGIYNSVTVAAGLLLVLLTGNYVAVSISYLAMSFFAVFYSLEPVRSKARGAWFSLTWQALARGLLPPIYASWILTGDPVRLWPLAVLAFLWVMSLQPTKDFDDVEGDRMFGIETLPVRYGVEGALVRMQAMVGLYTAVLLGLMAVGAVSVVYGVMVLLALTSFRALRVESVTENNLAWNIYYIGLAMHYLLYLAQGVATV